MFTGIVEELGEVVDVAELGDSALLTVQARLEGDIAHGASIAINGVCLTVISEEPVSQGPAGGRRLGFDVMAETLRRSVIGTLKAGDQVNLERAVRVDGRLDGHVVQGHVDGTGVILARTPGQNWDSVRVGLPAQLARYVAEKGSIAVDGVSLTVTAVGTDWFEIGLIPQTRRATTLGSRAVGDPVNLEVDVLAKYAERLLSAQLTSGGSR